MGRVRTYVGLGANIGSPAVGNGAKITNPADSIAAAVHALAGLPGARLVGVSRLYATAPVGVSDQPEFRNAVAALDVPGGADPTVEGLALLVALKELERALGRRDGPRWGPRALDLDLLVFGGHAIHAKRPSGARSAHPDRAAAQWLTVPHASARDRLFVLAPLADLAPGLRPPGWGETVGTARRRAELREGPASVRPMAVWDRATGSWRPASPGIAANGGGGRGAGPASGGSGAGP